MRTSSSTTDRHYPTKLVGLTNPSKVVVGQYTGSYSSSCALDGTTVRCWGNNSYGQVGNGTIVSPVTSPTPVLLADKTTAFGPALDIFPGDLNFCALRTGGTLWCWGSGFASSAGNFGVTNVVTGGWADDPRFLTSDGAYHIGALVRTPNCGPL